MYKRVVAASRVAVDGFIIMDQSVSVRISSMDSPTAKEELRMYSPERSMHMMVVAKLRVVEGAPRQPAWWSRW